MIQNFTDIISYFLFICSGIRHLVVLRGTQETDRYNLAELTQLAGGKCHTSHTSHTYLPHTSRT